MEHNMAANPPETPAELRDSRLQMRVSATTRAALERAAALHGVKLTDFVIAAAMERANEIIDRQHSVFASESDWARIQQALDSPGQPHPRLREAFDRHG